ncbi:SHOCT domain-containing protein [Cellulomonas alba]|uniref:SHOCT domain-containing protein n=1 Tax=Cellulomonas alba TaxID=3053467 RepID=A0ABT7SJE6_9CELL|nr:SHOCT domain-containing protein [Cellulomonas alba]MDM7856298.1 SHOCT domain-containing protein [Cellulomonas alba]
MPGLIRGVARTAVIAGTASAVSGRVQRRQQGRWAEQDAQAAAQQSYAQPQYAQPQAQAYAQPVYVTPVAAPEPEPLDMDTKIAHLKQLAELRDAGVLSPAEFEAQKAVLLG